jgi:hypothetical protein
LFARLPFLSHCCQSCTCHIKQNTTVNHGTAAAAAAAASAKAALNTTPDTKVLAALSRLAAAALTLRSSDTIVSKKALLLLLDSNTAAQCGGAHALAPVYIDALTYVARKQQHTHKKQQQLQLT